MIRIICRNCRKLFELRNPNEVYCSRKCQIEKKNEKRIKKYWENKEIKELQS